MGKEYVLKHGSLTAINLYQYVLVLSLMVLASTKLAINSLDDQKNYKALFPLIKCLRQFQKFGMTSFNDWPEFLRIN